ncbi:autotransporter outer membrane beta-barrel domain-containing protein [Alienimonas chondri]|uniref:Autotransporter domain-containing protein n=1 Tax=Alienimonas chondri TaxID=2681879 RepID=A0ABX1VF07_9PLAN|nr:autotransporter outer membrane beta-barrel domain-containing protein [Alienimonas chondri]NNJ26654.1 hypothetical protein [Alienimonas chondri]
MFGLFLRTPLPKYVRRRVLRWCGPAFAAAALTSVGGSTGAQETHTQLTIGSHRNVTNSFGANPANPLGLDLLVTGPARTSAPTLHADSLGTRINAAYSLTVSAGAKARLAGLTNDGNLSVSGSVDTLFDYSDGAGGSTESVFASVVNNNFLGTFNSSTFETGDYFNSATGETYVQGNSTMTVHGIYADSGKTQVSNDGTLNATGIYRKDAGTTRIFGNGALNARDVRIAAGSEVKIGWEETFISPGAPDEAVGGGSLNVTERLVVDGTLTAATGPDGTGTLTLAPGAVLTGSGTIDLGATWLLGTVAPGNSPGTMTFGSGITTNSATRLEIELVPTPNPVAGTDNDLIAVTGTATIDGGTVVAQRWGEGKYLLGTEYAFLTADDLVVNQELTVVSDIVGVGFGSAFTAGAGGNYRLIVTTVTTPLNVAASVNQLAVAEALTTWGGGPLVAAFNTAVSDAGPHGVPGQELLADLSGELYGSYLTDQTQNAARFFDFVTEQTWGAPYRCGRSEEGPALTGWLAAYGVGGRIQDDGNARGAASSVGGAAFGLTVFADDRLSAGLFYGQENGELSVPQAESFASTGVYRAGGWSRVDAGPLYLRQQSQIAFVDTESRRSFDAHKLGIVTGSFESTTTASELEAGRRFGDAAAYFAPSIALRYFHTRLEGFRESGGDAALAVQDSSHSSLRARLGLRSGAALPPAGRVPMLVTLAAFYERDLNDSSVADVDSSFVGSMGTGVGPTFTARGVDYARDRVTLGPGVVLGGGPMKIVADYRTGLTDRSVEHAGGARLELCY